MKTEPPSRLDLHMTRRLSVPCPCFNPLSLSDSGDVRLPAQRGGDSFPDELWRVSEEDAHQPQHRRVQR